jgi:hypothetical protein
MYDPGYLSHKKFILDGYKRLKADGKILLGFSSTRFPLKYARQRFQEIGFDANVFYGGTDKKEIQQELLEIIKL